MVNTKFLIDLVYRGNSHFQKLTPPGGTESRAKKPTFSNLFYNQGGLKFFANPHAVDDDPKIIINLKTPKLFKIFSKNLVP